jgi:hypothetical protein
MSSHYKLIAGAVVIAVAAGGGAAVAAIELSSSRAESASTVTASFGRGVGGYGLGGGRLGGRGLGGGLGPGGRPFHPGGFHGRRFFGSGVGAAAAYLGMPISALRNELADGRTLAALAVARKKTPAGLEAAMLAAQKQALDALVASGRLTQAQEQRVEAGLEARVKLAVERARPAGPPAEPRGSGPPASTD